MPHVGGDEPGDCIRVLTSVLRMPHVGGDEPLVELGYLLITPVCPT